VDASGFGFFSNLSKTGSTLKIKMGANMWLAWVIINNFLNCTDIKFPTQKELKILEQIQYLNL
jgi:hypothetical protein